MHYHLLPEDILVRNIDFFVNGYCVGIDISVPESEFEYLRVKLRNLRIVDPRFLHRNQIHVPDDQTSSDIERELFLDETSNG